ncbi:MAG TPA: hypothetical protein PKA41_13480 [Verrucomicrobiota bacterium]|nr:hypothetical protein [Verrucomicrobiota bacterium]
MTTITITNRSFFSNAAWYAVFAPLASVGVIAMGVAIGDSPADYFFGIAACILISSALASIVSLFGIRRHGWRAIIWKSALGFVLSCVIYLALVVIGVGQIAHQ